MYSILITAVQFRPETGDPRTDITDQTAYHLAQVGWKPLMTRKIRYLDDENHAQTLTIPAWDAPLPKRARQ